MKQNNEQKKVKVINLCKDIILRCKTDTIDPELKKTKIYKTWYDMHYRCYSSIFHMHAPTYIECEVCEEWQDFNNFHVWYQDNYYQIQGKRMDLDKDILVKGNKVYSPNTCSFVPHDINVIFLNQKSSRGKYPVGVSWDSSKQRFRPQVGRKKLGGFKTEQQAFAAYKNEKEKQIKELARKYKGQIPDRLYDAMVHYKVEITD